MPTLPEFLILSLVFVAGWMLRARWERTNLAIDSEDAQ